MRDIIPLAEQGLGKYCRVRRKVACISALLRPQQIETFAKLTLYVGWAGNLRDRLKSHAIGRRNGNQFCVYVFDRLVLPVLSAEEIHKAAEDLISLDAKVRDYIRKHCSYSLVTTANKDDARSLERLARRGLPSIGKPLLNPL